MNRDNMKYEQRPTDSMIQVAGGFEGPAAALERNLLEMRSV